ncbi:NAD(P)H-dependent FMN reductase [Pseudomonas nitritireducens]|uniref:NAD(P)H-dependent FMN reductase n=1 Tax=Pseudomonas nitroreducens TaxID=46680 RepID=A0A7W7KG64_PSENT|nr:NAD(P)H-dependent oxidoreductase [Pseudomonas nitritireducens]MBB4862211.1 NAD(P)H-dependent FMN reductase [Pseudomonas nitritireducens]
MSPNIVLVAGSSQLDSQSAKVARYLAARLESLALCGWAQVIDLGAQPLPLWPAPDTEQTWPQHRDLLREADALVVIAPEWHGMACPALKNFFLYAGLRELGHKPALPVGVSAGLGGAYPLTELRASSYKNSRIAYLPEQLVVRRVECMFNDGPPHDEDDERLRERADWALRMLCHYASATRGLRELSGVFDPAYANGM